MNTHNRNNNNNNRRRARTNRNSGNNGQQANRIDSRARGNAPQLLEKYKKLAQDAQHNGDRVQAEYYLQFADHYFRVLADNKARSDEARAKRIDERGQGGDEGDEIPDFRAKRRDDRPRRPREDEGFRQNGDSGYRSSEERDHDDDAHDSERDGAANEYEFPSFLADNVREHRDAEDADHVRPARGSRDRGAGRGQPRKSPRKPRQDAEDDGGRNANGDEIDVAVLPPSLGSEPAEKPKRRISARRTKPSEEGDAAATDS